MITGMPNIPNFAGLVSSAEDASISLGGAALINAVFGTTWAIVNQYGVPIVASDSFLSIDYENSQETSDDPIENGKVLTYNKTNMPRKATVTLAKGTGGKLGRGLWLSQLEVLVNSTLKFHIVTPEYVITNMQMVNLSYARSAQSGKQLIVVTIQFKETKIATVSYDKQEVKNVEDSKTADNGKVQATQVTNTSMLKAITGIFS